MYPDSAEDPKKGNAPRRRFGRGRGALKIPLSCGLAPGAAGSSASYFP
jgi:hypothetical protein